ncbi:hypothetical protein, partial [Yersinia pestis]|uniref:hypothetical protein n=6 Tax=Yersinia TaxID=629 RepID=UPI001C1FDA85
QNLPEVIKKVRISDLAWYGYWGGISDEMSGMVFVCCFMDNFFHLMSFISGYRCYDRHNSVRLW